MSRVGHAAQRSQHCHRISSVFPLPISTFIDVSFAILFTLLSLSLSFSFYPSHSHTHTRTAAKMNGAKLVLAFAEKLRAAPHRDATHIPYGEWFSVYVNGMKHMDLTAMTTKTATTTEGSSSSSSDSPRVPPACLRLIDCMLWSSLVAPRWNEVDLFLDEHAIADHLATLSTTAPSSSLSQQLWYRRFVPPQGLSLTDALSRDRETEARVNCDMLTDEFLCEPLLGGQTLEAWRHELRRQSEWLRTEAASSQQGARVSPAPENEAETRSESVKGEEASLVLMPFSALWAVKTQAFAHASSTPHGEARGLTLQERGARQVVLQSVHQVLQLQVELNDAYRQRASTRGPQSSFSAPRLRLAVIPPSEEFRLLCALPRLRRTQQQQQQQNQRSSRAQDVSVPPCLHLANVCESVSTRLVYLLYCQLAAGAATQQWQLVAPTAAHTELRRYAAGALQAFPVRSQTCLREQLVDERQRGGGVIGIGESRSIHRQARQGCHDAVRRMTQREENIRQSYSQK